MDPEGASVLPHSGATGAARASRGSKTSSSSTARAKESNVQRSNAANQVCYSGYKSHEVVGEQSRALLPRGRFLTPAKGNVGDAFDCVISQRSSRVLGFAADAHSYARTPLHLHHHGPVASIVSFTARMQVLLPMPFYARAPMHFQRHAPGGQQRVLWHRLRPPQVCAQLYLCTTLCPSSCYSAHTKPCSYSSTTGVVERPRQREHLCQAQPVVVQQGEH